MKHDSLSQAHLEGMGLRLENTGPVRPLDALIHAALLLSGVVWLGLALVGSGLSLDELINSRVGRVGAGLIGLATLSAFVKAVRGRVDF